MIIDIDELKSWIGMSEQRSDTIAATPVQGLIAMLDREEPEPRAGDVIPDCGHWLYTFTPIPLQSALGLDGHPKRGTFLPPIPLPRRMWAGSKIEFHKALRV